MDTDHPASADHGRLSRQAPAARTSIHIGAFSHKNPIPAACRVGPLLESGSVLGTDPATGEIAPTIEAQCRFMLDNVRRIVEAAGGSTADIAKLTVWMKDRSQRPALNAPWLAMFPDPASRPARHAIHAPELDMGKLIECSFTAYIA